MARRYEAPIHSGASFGNYQDLTVDEGTDLSVHMDASGTLIGRLKSVNGPLFFWFHQDTVRHGGKYDGIMGVCFLCWL